jgi:hypothetical protein
MKNTVFAFLLTALLALLAGCEKNESVTESETNMGYLVIRMTDSPGSYQAVNIVVDSVRVHIDLGDSLSGWYTLSRTRAVYDLLSLTNGIDTTIAEGPVPAGLYSQLRLYIGEGSSIVRDSIEYPLEIPSGSQSGLKLNVHADIQPGFRYVLMIDFDVARSIVVTGNKTFKLKPVIQAVANAASGSIIGIVVPDSTRPTVWAIAGADTTTTIAAPDGFFKLSYLVPGTYLVQITPADTAYRDTTFTGILVNAGSATNLGTIQLQMR